MKIKLCPPDEETRDPGNADGSQGQACHGQTQEFEMTQRAEARRLKELGQRNRKLKKMLVGSRLKTRVLKIVNTKKP